MASLDWPTWLSFWDWTLRRRLALLRYNTCSEQILIANFNFDRSLPRMTRLEMDWKMSPKAKWAGPS